MINLPSCSKRVCIFFCLIGSVFCQNGISVRGQIVSEDNQKGIEEVNIYVKEFNIGITSSKNGVFLLNNIPFSEEILLRFSRIGYKDLEKKYILNKGLNEIGTIFLVPDTIKVKEIFVDAHTELEPKRLASHIDIYGTKYHETLQSSLALTIKDETGLSIRSMGQGSTQPVLRGYSGDRFLLTEDGITAGDLSNTSIDHTISMDMASYNNIRVIRGPEALLYGSNTIGGVIDVSRYIEPGMKFKDVSANSIFGTDLTDNGLNGLFGNFTIFVPVTSSHQIRFSALNRSTSDEVTAFGTIKNSALTNDELTASYSYFGKNFRSTISYDILDMIYGIPGSPEGHIDGVDIVLNKNTQRFNFHKETSLLNFETFDIDQRFIRYNHSESEKGSSFPSVILEQDVMSVQSTLRKPGLQIGSLLLYRDFVAREFYWTPDTEEINIALFGLIEKEVNQFTLQFSARSEHLSVIPDVTYNLSNIETDDVKKRNYSLTSAGFSVFRNWNRWEVSITSMHTGRVPGIEDLYSDGPHLGVYSYEIGNPKLDLETTNGLEASLVYKSEGNKFEITGYQNYSPNYHQSTKMGNCDDQYIPGLSHPCAGASFIEWGSGSSGWLYKYEMRELRSLVQGIESDFILKLNSKINVYGNYSIVRGLNLSERRPLEYMPPDKFLLSTVFNFDSFSTSIIMKKVLSQMRIGEFETKTDGYSLLGMSMTYNLISSKFLHKIIIQADNLFNIKYYNHLSRIKNIMPEKGRNLCIQYRLFF